MAKQRFIFGYGSLASPSSLARTIGHELDLAQMHSCVLAGYQRAWNYGAPAGGRHWQVNGDLIDDGVIVFLGIVEGAGGCPGVLVSVNDDELVALDRRERYYDRIDVTNNIRSAAVDLSGAVVETYWPRPSAVERFESAKRVGRAAVERRYLELCEGAFGALGRLDEYQSSTPAPDVPVVDFVA